MPEFLRDDLIVSSNDRFNFYVTLRKIQIKKTSIYAKIMKFINFSDAPTEIPKYKSEENETRLPEDSEVRLSVANSASNVGSSTSDPNIDKLRVNLFSGSWGENSGKGEASTPGKLEQQTRDVLVVNYSNGDSSEVEMLDSSTAHIEYN